LPTNINGMRLCPLRPLRNQECGRNIYDTLKSGQIVHFLFRQNKKILYYFKYQLYNLRKGLIVGIMIILGYINLGILLFLVGLVISVYVHTDKKINESSERTDKKIEKLSDEIKENNKSLNDRIDRLYDILVHMGFREERIHRDKAANE